MKRLWQTFQIYSCFLGCRSTAGESDEKSPGGQPIIDRQYHVCLDVIRQLYIESGYNGKLNPTDGHVHSRSEQNDKVYQASVL